VAVIGPSGHGKSTLLQLIGGLDRPTDGTVWLDGENLVTLNPRQLAAVRARKVGFVFQFFNLLPHLTALENVQTALWFGGVPSARARARGLELLDNVGLADRVDYLPAQLSGGQQQRVAVARALANEPELLLLDEPTGNLDSAAEADVLMLFAALHRQGRTLVMVTHNSAMADRADRVVQLRDGKIESDTSSMSAGDGCLP
jgi:putative ABC transport system ATP-binding protein